MAINVGSVAVSVVPDASRFNALLKEKLRDLTATIKVDADTVGATVLLDAMKIRVDELAAKSPTIKVNVDAAGAVAELAAVGAEADRTANKSNSAGNSAGGGWSSLGRVVGVLTPAFAAAGVAAVGAGGAILAAAASAGPALGVLAIAAGGVVKAMGLLGQQQTAQAAASQAAANGAAAHAQAIVSAQRQIESAQQGVASAQYGLIQADQQEQSALQALQSAREAATRQLTSMANASVDARLAERQAALDLETATANYTKTMQNAGSTEQQRQQAALDLAKAQQHLKESHQAATNAQVDNTKAQKAGVDGAPQVVSAVQAVASAHHQQQQAALAVKNAQQAVTVAMEAMATAQRNSAGSTSASLAAVNAKIAALDPTVRSFAEYLRGTWAPIWKQVQAASAGGLLPGVQAGLESLRPVMPQIEGVIRSLSKALGDLFKAGSQALAGPFWQQFMQFIKGTAGSTLNSLGSLFGSLARNIATLMQAFAPLIPVVVSVLKVLGDALVQLLVPLEPIAKVLLIALRDALVTLAPVMPVVAQAITAIVRAFLPVLPIFAQLIRTLLPPLAQILIALAPLISQFVSMVGTMLLRALVGLMPSLVQLAQILFPALQQVLVIIAPYLPMLIDAFIQIVKAVAPFIPQLVQMAISLLPPMLDLLRRMLPILTLLIPMIGPLLTGAFKILGGAISAVIGIVQSLLTAWDAMWQKGKDIGHWFANDFVGFFQTAWTKIHDGWSSLVKEVGGLWANLKHYLMDPVAFVVRYVINDGLIAAWDWVVSHLHLPGSWHADPMHVPAVPPLAMAQGGVLPGYTPGRDVHQFYSPTGGSLALSGGEAIMVPEWTRAVGGPAAVQQMNAAARGRAFAGGGVWDFVTNLIPGMAAVKDMSPQMNALMSDPVSALKSLVSSAMGGLSSAAPMFGLLRDTAGSLAGGVGQAIKDNLLSLISAVGGNFGAGTPASSAPSSQAANVAIVKSWASPYGWQSGAEWDALVSVINRESGFRNTAQNPTSTAYGMFQFLDSTWGNFGFSKTSDPVRQAQAGLKYISQVYNDPLGALRHEQAFGWYDQGGLVPPGPSLVYNGTGGPELIAPQHTFEQIISGASGGSSGGPASFTGNLYLDSGEFLGKVRGIAAEEAGDALMMAANRGDWNRR